MKNFTNYFILLYFNSKFSHLRFDSAAPAIENLNKAGFWRKKHWQQIDFINHQIKTFFVLKLNMSFSYVFPSSPPTAVQISNASGINMQFIITYFDVCSSTSHQQFEWSKFDILRSWKNFVSLIFFVHICVIKLFFIFTKSACHFILFFLSNGPFCVDEYLNNYHW